VDLALNARLDALALDEEVVDRAESLVALDS